MVDLGYTVNNSVILFTVPDFYMLSLLCFRFLVLLGAVTEWWDLWYWCKASICDFQYITIHISNLCSMGLRAFGMPVLSIHTMNMSRCSYTAGKYRLAFTQALKPPWILRDILNHYSVVEREKAGHVHLSSL